MHKLVGIHLTDGQYVNVAMSALAADELITNFKGHIIGSKCSIKYAEIQDMHQLDGDVAVIPMNNIYRISVVTKGDEGDARQQE